MSLLNKIKNYRISTKGYLPNSPDKNEPSLVIPSNYITMKDVPHKILAEDLETGEKRIMNPEEEHFFNGKKGIKETPLQKGGKLYADSLANYNNAKAQWEKEGKVKFGSDLSYDDLKSTAEYEEWESPTDIGRIGFVDLMYDDQGSMIPVSVPIYEKPEKPIVKKTVAPKTALKKSNSTIYTSDKNDPRLKKYEDELAAYNYGLNLSQKMAPGSKSKESYNKLGSDTSKIKDSPMSFLFDMPGGSLYNLYEKNDNYKKFKTKPTSVYTSDTHTIPFYKKPIKRVIYVQPEVEETILFDPEGTGYDMESAKKAGLKPDSTGHWQSRDPETGLILKGRSHSTFDKTLEGEDRAGYEIQKGKDGRYYSFPKKNSIQYIEGTPGKVQHFKWDSTGTKFPLGKDEYNRLKKEGKLKILKDSKYQSLQQGGVVSSEVFNATQGYTEQEMIDKYNFNPQTDLQDPFGDDSLSPEQEEQAILNSDLTQEQEKSLREALAVRRFDSARPGGLLRTTDIQVQPAPEVQSSLESFSSSFALGKDMIEKSFWDKMEADAEQGVGFGNIIRQYLGKEWIPSRIEDNAKDIERNYTQLAAKYDQKHLELSDMWNNPERFWAHDLPEIMGQAIPLVALPLGGAGVGLAVGGPLGASVAGMTIGGIAGSAMGVYQEAMSEAGDVVHRAYEELQTKYPNADKKDLVRQAFELSETAFDRQTAALIMTEMPQLALNLFLPGVNLLGKGLTTASRAGYKTADQLLKARVKYGKTANVAKLGTYLTGNVIFEGGQEGVQYVINEDIINSIKDPEYQQGLSWSELWDNPDFIENVKSGGLMGVVMGGGFRALNSAMQNKVNELAKKTPVEISDYLNNEREEIYLNAIANNKEPVLRGQILRAADSGSMADKTITDEKERVKESKKVANDYIEKLNKRTDIWQSLGQNDVLNNLPVNEKQRNKTQAYFNEVQIDNYKKQSKVPQSLESKEEIQGGIKYLEAWNNWLLSERTAETPQENIENQSKALLRARAAIGLSEKQFKDIEAQIDTEIGDYAKVNEEIITDKTPLGQTIREWLNGSGIKVKKEEEVKEEQEVEEQPIQEQEVEEAEIVAEEEIQEPIKRVSTLNQEVKDDLKQKFTNALENQDLNENDQKIFKSATELLGQKKPTIEQKKIIQQAIDILPTKTDRSISITVVPEEQPTASAEYKKGDIITSDKIVRDDNSVINDEFLGDLIDEGNKEGKNTKIVKINGVSEKGTSVDIRIVTKDGAQVVTVFLKPTQQPAAPAEKPTTKTVLTTENIVSLEEELDSLYGIIGDLEKDSQSYKEITEKINEVQDKIAKKRKTLKTKEKPTTRTVPKRKVEPVTELESYAKEQGYSPTKGQPIWKYAIQSINKQKRTAKEKELPVTKEAFEKLTKKEIEEAALSSESIQIKKQQEKEALERPAPQQEKPQPKETQTEEAPKPTAKQTRKEKAEPKIKDKEKKVEKDEKQWGKDFDKYKTKNRGKFSSTPIDPELVSLLARYIDIQIRKGILSIEKLILKLKNYLKKNNIKNADEIVDNNINEILRASNKGNSLLKKSIKEQELEEDLNDQQLQGEELVRDAKIHGETVKEISKIIFEDIDGIEKNKAQLDLMAISEDINNWVKSKEDVISTKDFVDKFKSYVTHSEQMGLFIPVALERFTSKEIASVVSTFNSQQILPFLNYLNKKGGWQLGISNEPINRDEANENLKNDFQNHIKDFEETIIDLYKNVKSKDVNYKNLYEQQKDKAEKNNRKFIDDAFKTIMAQYSLNGFNNENMPIVKKYGKGVHRNKLAVLASGFPQNTQERTDALKNLIEYDLDMLQYLTGLDWQPFLNTYIKDYKQEYIENKIPKSTPQNNFTNPLMNFVITTNAMNGNVNWKQFQENIISQFSKLSKGIVDTQKDTNFKTSLRTTEGTTKTAIIEKNELIISANDIVNRTGEFFDNNLIVRYYKNSLKSAMPLWAIDGAKNTFTQESKPTGKISPSDYVAMQLSSFLRNNIFNQNKSRELSTELNNKGFIGEFGMTVEQMGSQEQQVYVGAMKMTLDTAKKEYKRIIKEVGIPNQNKLNKYIKELTEYIKNDLQDNFTLGKYTEEKLAEEFMYNFIVNKHYIDMYFQGSPSFYVEKGLIQYLKEQVKRSQSRWSNGDIPVSNIEGGFAKELKSVIINDPKKIIELLGESILKEISDGVVLFSNKVAKQAAVSWGSLLSKGRDSNTILKVIYSKIRDTGIPYQIKSEWVALPEDFTAMSPELKKLNEWMNSNEIDVLVFDSSAKLKEKNEVMSLFEEDSDQLLKELPSPKENQVLPIDTGYLLLQQDAIKDVKIKENSKARVQILRQFSLLNKDAKNAIYQPRNTIIEKRTEKVEKLLGETNENWHKEFINTLSDKDYDEYHKELANSVSNHHPHIFEKEDSVIGRLIGNKVLQINVQGNSYRAFPDMGFTDAYDENGNLFKLKEPLQPMRITKEDKVITYAEWKKLPSKKQQEYTVKPAQHLVPLNSGLSIGQQIITTRTPSDGFQNHPIGEVVGFLPASMHNLIVVDPVTQQMAGEDNDADERHVWARLNKGTDKKEITEMFDAIWDSYSNPKYFEALTSPIKQEQVNKYLVEEKKQQGLIDKYDFVNGHTQAYKLVKESASMIGPIARSIAQLAILADSEVSLYAPFKFPKIEEVEPGKFKPQKEYYELQHFHKPKKEVEEDLLIAIKDKSDTMKIIGNENLDAPKLQNVELMGLTESTVNSFVLLAMLGVNIKHIINFYKQPSIKEYINKAREGLSVGKTKTSGVVLNESLQQAILDNQINDRNQEAVQMNDEKFGMWMNTYVTPKIELANITNENIKNPTSILSMLTKVNNISKELLPINELIGATEKGASNYGKLRAWQDSLNKVVENETNYIDYTNLTNSGTIKSLSYISPSEISLTYSQSYYDKYRPVGSKLGKTIINALKKYYSISPYFKSQKKPLLMIADKYQAINDGLNMIWVSTALNDLYKNEFKSAPYNARETLKEFKKAKKEIIDNDLLNILHIENNILRVKKSEALKLDTTIDDVNNYKSEFSKLPNKLQNLLITYSFYQNKYGESTWSGSYAKYVSNEKQQEISNKLSEVLKKWQNFSFTQDEVKNQKILKDYNVRSIMSTLLKNDESLIPEVLSYIDLPQSVKAPFPPLVKYKGKIYNGTLQGNNVVFNLDKEANIKKVYDQHATQLQKLAIGIEDFQNLPNTIPLQLPMSQKMSNMIENQEKSYIALDDNLNKKMKGNGMYSYVIEENPSDVKEVYIKQIGKLNPETNNLEDIALGMGYESLDQWQKQVKDTAVQEFIVDKKKTLVFYEVYPKSQMDFMVADEASWERLRMADPELADFMESHLQKGYPGVNVSYIKNWMHKGMPVLGATIGNSVFIDESKALQDTYYHEFAHMYWDALPDDNIIKQKMTEQFTDVESAITAIGRAGLELSKEKLNELQNKSKKFTTQRFLTLLRRFWRAVKRAIGKGKDSNARKMAEAIWYKDVSIVKGKKEITVEDFINDEYQYQTGQKPADMSKEAVKQLEDIGIVLNKVPKSLKEEESTYKKLVSVFQNIVNKFQVKTDAVTTYQDVKNVKFTEDEKSQLKDTGLVDKKGNVETTDKNINYVQLELRSYGATQGWVTTLNEEGKKVPATGTILTNPYVITDVRPATKDDPFILLPLDLKSFFFASREKNQNLYGKEGGLKLSGIKNDAVAEYSYEKMSEYLSQITDEQLINLVSKEGKESGTLALLQDYKGYVEDFTTLYKQFQPAAFGQSGTNINSAEQLHNKNIEQLQRIFSKIKASGRSSVSQRGYMQMILAPLATRVFTKFMQDPQNDAFGSGYQLWAVAFADMLGLTEKKQFELSLPERLLASPKDYTEAVMQLKNYMISLNATAADIISSNYSTQLERINNEIKKQTGSSAVDILIIQDNGIERFPNPRKESEMQTLRKRSPKSKDGKYLYEEWLKVYVKAIVESTPTAMTSDRLQKGEVWTPFEKNVLYKLPVIEGDFFELLKKYGLFRAIELKTFGASRYGDMLIKTEENEIMTLDTAQVELLDKKKNNQITNKEAKKRWKEYQKQAEQYWEKGVDVEGHSLFNTTGLKVPMSGINFKLDSKLKEETISSNFTATIDNYIRAKFYKHKMEEMIPMAYFFNSYYDTNQNEHVKKILSIYDDMVFMKKKPKSAFAKQPGIEKSLKFMTGWTAFRFLALNPLASVFNVSAGQTQNVIDMGGKSWAKSMLRYLTNPYKAYKIMDKMKIVNTSIDAELSLPEAMKNRFQNMAFIMITAAENFNQAIPFIGYMGDRWNDYDNEGNVKSGRKGLSYNEIYYATDNIQRTHGAYHPLFKRQMNLTAEGMALMQFKGWLPETFLRMWQKEMVDSSGRVRKGILNSFFEEESRINIRKILKGEMQYSEMSEVDKYNFGRGFRSLVLTSIFMLLLASLDEDDNEARKNLRRALGDITYMFDMKNLQFLLNAPVPAFSTATDLMKAFDSFIQAETYKSDSQGGKKGDLKFIYKTMGLLPFSRLNKYAYKEIAVNN